VVFRYITKTAGALTPACATHLSRAVALDAPTPKLAAASQEHAEAARPAAANLIRVLWPRTTR